MTQVDNQKSAMGDRVDRATSIQLYKQMVLIRRFELRVQSLYRSGRIPGFIHLYVGEEATAVGICAHLNKQDVITSTHRGHGHALAKGGSPKHLLAELAGRATGSNGGRGGSMHLYDADCGLLGTNGFVGGGIPLAVGAAIGMKVRKNIGISVAFFGDGAVSHGTFHESINFAATLAAPIVFVCENNLYATSTPLHASTRNIDIASRASGYGILGTSVDGNDVLAVYRVMEEAADRARTGHGPTLIEARTYRTVGHHEGEPLVGTYRTQDELDEWKEKCPIQRMSQHLIDTGIASKDEIDQIDADIESKVDEAEKFAMDSPQPDVATVGEHMWDPMVEVSDQQSIHPETQKQNWLDATRDAIAGEMRRDPHLVYFGEGIAERGGSFAHTKGLWKEFGSDRLIDTPICEMAFTGAAAGAAATGCRAIADLMFADFMFESASQIIQQAAKLRYMSNGQFSVPLLIRGPMGAIKSAGPHHSGSYYPMWSHCPGLSVVVPSNAADAKGLFTASLRTGDPVIMMEPKILLGSECAVPVGEWLLPFGQANIVREGNDLTIVTCGALVHRCTAAGKKLEARGIGCEVIDLRTIVPIDVETVINSLAKTNHLLVVDEAFSMCGLGAEIAAIVMEHGFDLLDAPVGRVHTDPVANPFSPLLEEAVSVTVKKICYSVESVLSGIAPRQRRPSSRSSATRVLIERESVEDEPAEVSSATQDHKIEGVPIVMPHQDLTITKATVVRWLAAIGDQVKQNQPVVEVETDKAVSEIDAPVDGVLVQIIATEDTVVALGELLGAIDPTDK